MSSGPAFVSGVPAPLRLAQQPHVTSATRTAQPGRSRRIATLFFGARAERSFALRWCGLALGAAKAVGGSSKAGPSHAEPRMQAGGRPTGWDLTGNDVLALDFDGVICDSADETMYSAFRAVRRRWPDYAPDVDPSAYVEQFRRLRPVIETGFENLALVRMMVEGVPEGRILADFKGMCAALFAELGVSKEEAIAMFGGERDLWIKEDLESWVATNRSFPGTAEALRSLPADLPLFIITTKQRRFARTLLQSYGVAADNNNIFAVRTGAEKAGVLSGLMGREDLKGRTFHFVEDRLETLEEMTKHRDLDGVRLYFADWGYNTPAEREAAGRNPRYRFISIGEFPAFAGR
eukprot:tig00000135_g7968.t1